MIILGDNYSFTNIELERLKRKVGHIDHISCKDLSSQEIIGDIEKHLHSHKNRLILLNTKAKLENEVLTYLTRLELKGTKYITIENFLEEYLNKCYIDLNLNSNTFLEDIHQYTLVQYIQKRIIDLVGVVFLFPFILLAAGITFIKMRSQSPGPLLFIQKRVGKREKEFKCVKLRTMHLNAEKDGAMFATEDDVRAFEWGRVLRKLKGDELLQIWNVIRGEMHLIGPRPERKVWVKTFEKSIPIYTQRHVVAPGITGLAQVKYPYGSSLEDAEQKLMYDLYYIKNWNMKLELEIMWKTALLVLTKKRKSMANF